MVGILTCLLGSLELLELEENNFCSMDSNLVSCLSRRFTTLLTVFVSSPKTESRSTSGHGDVLYIIDLPVELDPSKWWLFGVSLEDCGVVLFDCGVVFFDCGVVLFDCGVFLLEAPLCDAEVQMIQFEVDFFKYSLVRAQVNCTSGVHIFCCFYFCSNLTAKIFQSYGIFIPHGSLL